MYQKLLNSTGECLIISSFINATNIGKNFWKMFHNSWGANNFGLNCTQWIKDNEGNDMQLEESVNLCWITAQEHVQPRRNVNTEIPETRDEYKHRSRMEMQNN